MRVSEGERKRMMELYEIEILAVVLLAIMVAIVFATLIGGLLFIWWKRKKRVKELQDLEEVLVEMPETRHQVKTVREKMRENMKKTIKTEKREGVIIFEYKM